MSIQLDPPIKHNIFNLELNQNIYRVIEINHLIDIFKNNQFIFTTPDCWDDPYENFLRTCYNIERLTYSKISYESYFQRIFGQCWMSRSESDATWRIYSPNKNKVKIKTTILKFKNLLSTIKIEGARTYISKINYKSRNEIDKKIENGLKKHFQSFHGDSLINNYLLVKRREFSHENEVRILLDFRKSKPDKFDEEYILNKSNSNLCYFQIDDPNDFIDEIIFDPRYSDSLIEPYTYYFKNEFGFKKKIEKSHIYDPPNVTNYVTPFHF